MTAEQLDDTNTNTVTRIPFFSVALTWANAAFALLVGAAMWLQIARRWMGFHQIKFDSLVILVAVIFAVPAWLLLRRKTGSFQSAGLERAVLYCLTALVAAVIAALAFVTSSPHDPIRLQVSAAYAASSIWIPMIALLPSLRKIRAPFTHLAVSLCLGLGLFQAVRAKGVDGFGKPIMEWKWGKTAATKNPSPVSSEKVPVDANETFSSEPWPQFLGPNRDGLGLPMFASNAEATPDAIELVWEKPVGAGWSGFVADQGVAYSQEMSGDTEQVFAVSMRDGSRLWSTALGPVFRSAIGGDGSRSTPTIAGDKLIALSALGELACMDKATGTVLWRHHIISDSQSEVRVHGVTGSPLVTENRVYVFPGSKTDNAVLAYDLVSGKLVGHAGNQMTGYASLGLATLDGTPMILAAGGQELVGYSLALDREFFRYPFTNSEATICSQPQQISNSELLLSAGYGTGCRRIRLTAEADKSKPWRVDEVWSQTYLQTKFSTTVVFGDAAFGLDNGILQCVRLSDGEKQWKSGRYGFGQLLLCPPHVVVQCEDGSLAVVQATAEQYREQFRIPQLEGKTWNVPAWSRPYLLIRNDSIARCLRVREKTK
jgi:outer membrane protein assembly factor BamB